MPTKSSKTLSELGKQVQPLPGEVDPKDARHKAAKFAAVERIRLKPGVAAQVAAQVNRKKQRSPVTGPWGHTGPGLGDAERLGQCRCAGVDDALDVAAAQRLHAHRGQGASPVPASQIKRWASS